MHLSVGRCYRTPLFRKRSRFSDIVHCYFKNASESSCFIAYDSCKWSFHMNFILWFIHFAMGLVYTGVIHIKQTYILLIEPTLYDSRGYRRTLAVTYVHVRLMGSICCDARASLDANICFQLSPVSDLTCKSTRLGN